MQYEWASLIHLILLTNVEKICNSCYRCEGRVVCVCESVWGREGKKVKK